MTPGMEQGMKQSMVATATMQLFMRTLQATNMELQQIAASAMAANPALEEAPLPPQEEGESPLPNTEAAARHDFLINSLESLPTLANYLEEQIRSSALPAATEAAALKLLPHLDRHGYFEAEPADIAKEEGITPQTFSKALRAIQDLEPAGVGSRDLRESLMLQLERLGEKDGLPMHLLEHYWQALTKHQYAEAAKKLNLPEHAVRDAAHRIARLNPDPGSGFAAEERTILQPDLILTRDGNELTLQLTGENVPNLTLSAQYREMMAEKADNAELRQYLSRCFREGRELIRAIQERQQTIFRVASAIVEHQRSFFLKGAAHMRPLKMEDIAEDTQLSISTVSRAVNGKYLQYGSKMWELRHFFSAALPATEKETEHAAGAIQAKIAAIIAEENPAKPYSDASIEKFLAAEGIQVARRTIAKYREQLKILPASLRKR